MTKAESCFWNTLHLKFTFLSHMTVGKLPQLKAQASYSVDVKKSLVVFRTFYGIHETNYA